MASAALGEAQILESSFMPAVAAQACRLAAPWLVQILELVFTRASAAQACRLQRPGACCGIVARAPPRQGSDPGVGLQVGGRSAGYGLTTAGLAHILEFTLHSVFAPAKVVR